LGNDRNINYAGYSYVVIQTYQCNGTLLTASTKVLRWGALCNWYLHFSPNKTMALERFDGVCSIMQSRSMKLSWLKSPTTSVIGWLL